MLFGQVCSAGACVVTCASGLTNCSGSCTNRNTDPNNCGACGTVCPTRANATPTCAAGTCGFTCNAGFADCDRSAANGCEVNIGSDTSNCGACGSVCTITNGVGACVSGACRVASCNTNFADCDGTATNGCEVNTTDDESHCGSCSTVCPGSATCLSGVCSTANCRTVAGVRWCYVVGGCGLPCNSVCSTLGLPFTISDAAWFAAQDSAPECQAINDAFGLGGTVSMASYTYACAEDNSGSHTSGTLVAPLLCSVYSGCPANHRTNMDNIGTACSSSSSRLSLCPCQ